MMCHAAPATAVCGVLAWQVFQVLCLGQFLGSQAVETPPGELTVCQQENYQQKMGSIDWLGKITGKSRISWDNLWFPVDFPLSQPIDGYINDHWAMFNSYVSHYQRAIIGETIAIFLLSHHRGYINWLARVNIFVVVNGGWQMGI